MGPITGPTDPRVQRITCALAELFAALGDLPSPHLARLREDIRSRVTAAVLSSTDAHVDPTASVARSSQKETSAP